MSRFLFTAVFLLSLVVVAMSADIPRMINVQGKAIDSIGVPISNGSHAAVFTIYDDSCTGNILWSEERVLPTTNGLFSIILGKFVSIPNSAFEGADRWLGIVIDDEEIACQRFTSMPYAYYAEFADTADYAASTGSVDYADSAGLTHYADSSAVAGYADSAGLVEYADSATVAGYAHTAGSADYADSAAVAGYADSAGLVEYADSATVAGYAHTAGSADYADSAAVAGYADSAGLVEYADSATVAGYAHTAGSADYADSAVVTGYAHIAGSADYADSAAVAGFANPAGGWFDENGVVRLVTDTDSVGIGTSTPSEKLEVDGNTVVRGNVGIDERLYHNGDENTYLEFNIDQIDLYADGLQMITAAETTQDIVVINEGSADIDFRVESNYNTHALFVRGSDSNVGIGESSPSYDLDVADDVRVQDDLIVSGKASINTLDVEFDYNSGWVNISEDQTITFAHGLGGTRDYYIVIVDGKNGYGIHQANFGTCPISFVPERWIGLEWHSLTTSSIKVHRASDDNQGNERDWDQVRVRIIKNQ